MIHQYHQLKNQRLREKLLKSVVDVVAEAAKVAAVEEKPLRNKLLMMVMAEVIQYYKVQKMVGVNLMLLVHLLNQYHKSTEPWSVIIITAPVQ